MATAAAPLLQGSPAEQMHVDQERTAGDDLRLPLPARQQPTRRLLCHRANGGNRRRAREDPAGCRHRGRSGLAKGKRIRRLALHDSDETLLIRGLANSQAELLAGVTTLRDCGGRGFLTVSLRDSIARQFATGPRILAALDKVSQRVGATPAQVSLAWLMAQPSIAAPIVSATSVAQLDEIAAAVRLDLDAEALAELDRASR